MHYRNIIFVEAPLEEISDTKIAELIKQGGAWPDTLNGKNIIPIKEIRQQHLDDCFDIIIDGTWFERETYRPWLPVSQWFERKPKDQMPTARWLRQDHKMRKGGPEYQFFAVALDCHN